MINIDEIMEILGSVGVDIYYLNRPDKERTVEDLKKYIEHYIIGCSAHEAYVLPRFAECFFKQLLFQYNVEPKELTEADCFKKAKVDFLEILLPLIYKANPEHKGEAIFCVVNGNWVDGFDYVLKSFKSYKEASQWVEKQEPWCNCTIQMSELV